MTDSAAKARQDYRKAIATLLNKYNGLYPTSREGTPAEIWDRVMARLDAAVLALMVQLAVETQRGIGWGKPSKTVLQRYHDRAQALLKGEELEKPR